MSFVLVVRMRAQEGNESRAVEIMRQLATASLTEAGCDAYVPCQDPEDARSFVLFEQYRDKAACEEHGQTEHFQRLAAGELFGLMESRERSIFESV